MEAEVVVYFADGHNVVGQIFISQAGLSVKKRTLFGGYSKNEALHIDLKDIAETKIDKYRMNKKAYYITTKDGNSYILGIGIPDITIPYIDSLIEETKK